MYVMHSSYQPTVGRKTAIVFLSGVLILARSYWRFDGASWLLDFTYISSGTFLACLTLVLYLLRWTTTQGLREKPCPDADVSWEAAPLASLSNNKPLRPANTSGVAQHNLGPAAIFMRIAHGVQHICKLTTTDTKSTASGSPTTDHAMTQHGTMPRCTEAGKNGAADLLASAIRLQSSAEAWQPGSTGSLLLGLRSHPPADTADMLEDNEDSWSSQTASSSADGTRDGGNHSSMQVCKGARDADTPSRGTAALTVPHSGVLAVDSVTSEVCDPLMGEVAAVIPSEVLLQFGALLGESSAELALSQARIPGAVGGGARSLMGDSDDPPRYDRGWEGLVTEHCGQRGLHYWAWRRYLRRGLFMYKTRTVYEGVPPDTVAAFTLDLEHKCCWDNTLLQAHSLPPPSCCFTCPMQASHNDAATPTVPAVASTRQPYLFEMGELQGKAATASAFLYSRCRFPPPMAARDYVYARRVWAKPDDGGCYIVSRSTPHPAPPTPSGRCLRVTDYASGIVVRACRMASGAPATEVVTLYFEDPHVSPGILNLGVRKGMWSAALRAEAALRAYASTPRAATRVAMCATDFGRQCKDKRYARQTGLPEVRQMLAARVGSGVGAALACHKPPCCPTSMLAAAYHACAVMCREVAAVGQMFTAAAEVVWRAHLLLLHHARRGAATALTPARCVLLSAGHALSWCARALTSSPRHHGGAWGVHHSRADANTALASHPIALSSSQSMLQTRSCCHQELGCAAVANSVPRQAARRLGRKLVCCMAAIAVRAVGIPLAHQLLCRASTSSCRWVTPERPIPASLRHRQQTVGQQGVWRSSPQGALCRKRRGPPWWRRLLPTPLLPMVPTKGVFNSCPNWHNDETGAPLSCLPSAPPHHA